MHVVLSRPYDEDNAAIADIYIVDHDTKTEEQFESEWLAAKEKIMQEDPEYNVSQILVAMKRKG